MSTTTIWILGSVDGPPVVVSTELASPGGVEVFVEAPPSKVSGGIYIGPPPDATSAETRSTSGQASNTASSESSVSQTTASPTPIPYPESFNVPDAAYCLQQTGQASNTASSESSVSQTTASPTPIPYPESFNVPDAAYCLQQTDGSPGSRNGIGIAQAWLCNARLGGQLLSGDRNKRDEYLTSDCFGQCWGRADCVAANAVNGSCQQFSTVESYSVSNGSTALLYTSRADLTFDRLQEMAEPSASRGLSTGAKAGIAVGAALVGAALLGLLVWVVLLRRRLSKSRPKTKKESSSDFEVEQTHMPPSMQETSRVQKAQSGVELDAERRPDIL